MTLPSTRTETYALLTEVRLEMSRRYPALRQAVASGASNSTIAELKARYDEAAEREHTLTAHLKTLPPPTLW